MPASVYSDDQSEQDLDRKGALFVQRANIDGLGGNHGATRAYAA